MSHVPQNKILVIAGPTATGKTGLAMDAAREFQGEVINCDSRQVYKKLDIGTAKPEIDARNDDGTVVVGGIRHHLLDFVDPAREYTLADFQKDAREAIADIVALGKLPILTGGTGLYIDSVVFDYDLDEEKDTGEDRVILQQLRTEELQKILASEAIEAYENLNESDRNNPHRLIRAIERSRNVPKSDSVSQSEESPYSYLYLVLDAPQGELNERITARTGKMFEDGLEEENARLREEGYTTEMPALKTIGYQEFDDYFAGKQTLEETKDLIETHTRQYAKRQRTWFGRNEEAQWVENNDDAMKLTENFLAD